MPAILCAKSRCAGEARSGSWASAKAWTDDFASRTISVKISPFRVRLPLADQLWIAGRMEEDTATEHLLRSSRVLAHGKAPIAQEALLMLRTQLRRVPSKALPGSELDLSYPSRSPDVMLQRVWEESNLGEVREGSSDRDTNRT